MFPKQFREFFIILVITIVYAIGYNFMKPSEFGFKDKIDPFYFSFTTMSTVGYGDLSPKTRRAKMVVMSQQFFLLISEVAIILKLLKK